MMGSMGTDHPIADGLDKVWGYTPSARKYENLIKIFAYDQSMAENGDLVEMRYESSIQEGFHESFSAMFPEPRQRHVDAMALTIEELQAIDFPILVIHGRDDQVIPLDRKLVLTLVQASSKCTTCCVPSMWSLGSN